MNLQRLFELQQNLDQHIERNHNLEDESLLSKKVLALQVELAELANETRCFKFWSNKQPSDKKVILEEFVDCLHFILTIGIEKGFTDVEVQGRNPQYDIVGQFSNLYIDINDFIVCNSKDHYITLFEDFLTLGNSLKFSKEEIEEAYYKKNCVNHERQKVGY
ncbi:dUTP diphosphatase [Clostridium sp. JN-1]|jgi:dimeric dUTPase (all-alpha-NTP-PPase superfamily)|uniref:dUTP diphosphatase n=1 Tax=Clostridium sp. JN-1 TaxID=2483110 RepID=UPI000F0B040B|nr:dUTP diphosphatase [Clostridium sp. JN-1]